MLETMVLMVSDGIAIGGYYLCKVGELGKGVAFVCSCLISPESDLRCFRLLDCSLHQSATKVQTRPRTRGSRTAEPLLLDRWNDRSR